MSGAPLHNRERRRREREAQQHERNGSEQVSRPDPVPHVFGYHEVFHLLTLAATGCQYAAIAFYVLPRA